MYGLTQGQIEGILYYAKETYTTWWISERIKKDWKVNVSPKSIGKICAKHGVEVETSKKKDLAPRRYDIILSDCCNGEVMDVLGGGFMCCDCNQLCNPVYKFSKD